MASMSGADSKVPGVSSLPICRPPDYSIHQYIAQEEKRHEDRSLVTIPGYPGRLSVIHSGHARDTVAPTWQKTGRTWKGGAFLSFV